MQKRDIVFRRVNFLRGPNIWTYRPVLEALVDIGDLEDAPSNLIPGLYERLTGWLPGLVEHRCGVGERGGFLQRLQEGTWAGHILEHVTIELQNLAGMQTGFGKARSTSERGVYKVVVRTREEQLGRACLEAGRALLLAAINDERFDLEGTLADLRELADSRLLGPSTAHIVEAATERRIPAMRLTEGNLVQLGYGAKQRRIWTAETDRTSAIAESIASDKDLTKRLLAACGVPVPQGEVVANVEQAWDAAQDVGLPVVVKPTDANHGRGVSLELSKREDVEAAFLIAEREGSDVIVERYIRGDEHRVLVVGGKVVAAARGESLYVTGDGRSTVRQLIDSQLNSDPRRGEAEEFPLETLILEREPAIRLLLERQGLSGDSVPSAGQRVLVQRNGNVSIDCTASVHRKVAARAALAARIVGLDIAGIDLVCEDISRPLEEQGGAIVEVNAGPGLLMHLKPAVGEAQPVGRAIVEHLFPGDDNGRIPVVGITGSTGTTLVARLVAWLLHLDGRHVGLACGDGLYLDRREVVRGDCRDWGTGQRLLLNRSVDAAVFEHAPLNILAEGLPYDRCSVGVVTDLTLSPALYEHDIRETEQLYTVLRTQVDVVLPDGGAVLNADDPAVLGMAELSDGPVVLYSLDPASPAIAAHRQAGGRAVFLREASLWLAMGEAEKALAALADIPLSAGEWSARQQASVLAAVGAAVALGISCELIRAALETFERRTQRRSRKSSPQ